MTNELDKQPVALKEVPSSYSAPHSGEIDLPLLRDNLEKTPWERMLANDDALNFAETLRQAMLNRNAKLK